MSNNKQELKKSTKMYEIPIQIKIKAPYLLMVNVIVNLFLKIKQSVNV